MNRLHQLKETLLQNIIDNENYKELEFVILNYNSQDGMDEWMAAQMQPYISSGRISYYFTTEPEEFSHSHSKNVAFKLAKGEILCSINADHFTGKDFAEYVNKCFCEDENIVLTTVDYFNIRENYHPPKDVYGKVCVKKTDFLKTRGFDERMNGYGFEDWDFVNRLELTGLKRKFIDNTIFLRFISHQNDERYLLDSYSSWSIYLNYLDPSSTDVIILYTTNKFDRGTILDNSSVESENYRYAFLPRNYKFVNSVKNKWENGTYCTNSLPQITLLGSRIETFYISENKDKLIDHTTGHIYYKLTNSEVIATIADFKYMLPNRLIMEQNLAEKIINPNNGCFGRASLIYNLHPEQIFI
jgi:hypothetical protein